MSVTFAQTPSASVVGRVTDTTGAVVPGVTVKVTNLDTNQTYSGPSNPVGDYTVPYLHPGRYSLEAKGDGFRIYKHTEFALEVDQALRLDIRLEIGAMAESITVTETPPALTTESGARGDVTSSAEVTEIPLNGRNFEDLAYLTGGVIPKGEGGNGQYAINGARADNVGFVIDGMSNTQRRNTGSMVTPPLESIQEFKLITSGFSAEYGRYAGGVLSAVTKNGGNRIHGSLYEFLRNDALDARNFFDVTKSKLRQNQFGASVSGPVFVPKLYDGRNRTFFLFSWQARRQISGGNERGVVPLPEMLHGDFSKAVDAYGKPGKVLDPLAKNAQFPGNQIPLSRLDPVSLKLAAFYPAPNLPGSVNNYIVQANGTTTSNSYTAKLDHSIGARDRLTLSAHWAPSNSFGPFDLSPIPMFASTTDLFGMLAGIRYIHILTPVLFNEAGVSFSRMARNQGWPGNTRDWAAEVGFVGATRNPDDLGIPYVNVNGYIPLGQDYSLPKIWAYNNFNYSDTMSWLHGRHAVKFGGDMLHYQYSSKDYGDLKGRLIFQGRFTTDTMADMLLGYPQSTRRLIDVGRQYLRISNYSGFVQDDFKVTPSLTLNLGLRYELLKQPVEKYGARSMFVPELGKIVMSGTGGIPNINDLIQQSGLPQYMVFARDVGLPRTITNTNYNDFAPRFGFAWRPFSNTRSVIRGGYGIFFGTDSLNPYNGLSNTYPYEVSQSFSATSTNPLALTVSNPFPAAKTKIAGVASTEGSNLHHKDQYLQSWNLTVERELGGGTVLEIAYAGSKGTHLVRRYDMNQPLYNPSLVPAGGTFPRTFPAFQSINLDANASNSIYSSGSVTLRRRLNKQFFVRAAYVYGKSIDETSDTGGGTSPNFTSAQDSRNLHSERGRSDFDVGHAFAASLIWQPRMSRHFLLRDWQISATTTSYTGAPFTPKMQNYDPTLGGAARPDRLTKGTLANPSPDAWFDRSEFPAVPVGSYRFGNSGRNILDGPGTFNINTGLSRRFRFSESKALQFRWESFNLTNRTNFNQPQTYVDVLNGGTIIAAKTSRQIQLGLRFEF